LHPLAKVTSMPKTGGKQFARLLRASRLDTPLLGTRNHHRGVVSLPLQFGLPLSRFYGHGRSLFRRITFAMDFKSELPLEQIWNAT